MGRSATTVRVAAGKWPFLLGGMGVLAVLALLAVGGRGRDADTAAASTSLLECLERADSACIYRYVGDHERSRGGVDASSLDKFVHRVWKPYLHGFAGHIRAKQQQHGLSHLDLMEMRHPDGRTVPLASFAVDADGKAIHPNVVLDMTMTALLAQRAKDEPLPQGASLEAFLAKELRKRSGDFEASGLKGATIPVQATGQSKFYSWSELADRHERRARLFLALPDLTKEGRAAALADYKAWEREGL